MLKILDHPTEHMSRVEMHKKYKGYAFIVIDTQDEHDNNGVSLPCSGKVYRASNGVVEDLTTLSGFESAVGVSASEDVSKAL